MENSVIEAYVTNLGKYNEGELVGEWVKFPVTKEEMDAVLNRIGIGEGYEEIFITDYDTSIYSLSSQLGEYENLDKLNYLAGVIAGLGTAEREKYEAVLESGLSLGQDGIDGFINLAYNLDQYDMLPDVKDEYDLGRYYVELVYGENPAEKIGGLADYIDFGRYGSDFQINEGGMFTDKGYIRGGGYGWTEYYDGSLEDIPDEYRLNAGRRAEKMTVLVVEPMKKPYVKEIVHTLENLQKEVGGSIEAVYPFEDRAAIVCNDEHKLNGMPLNRCLRDAEGEIYDILAGSFLVVGLTEQDFGSLTPEQIEKYTAHFQTPEMFVKLNGGLAVLPAEEPPAEMLHGQESEAEATYSIYQLRNGEDMRDYSFASMEELNRQGLTVNPHNYEKVYEAPKSAEDTLDSIYYRFNMEHPADFRGHSLSVSDVIVFHENGTDTAHYVDSYGFTVIPDFVAAKENDRAGARESINDAVNAETEAAAVPVVPDRSITHEDMAEYGYVWDGMIPLRERAAEKLYGAGLEVFVLHQDNAEAVIENKDQLTAHAENGGIFGIEKAAWAKFLETNPIAKVEELLEDDYGMIDGIINNGSADEKEPGRKSSVREKLKEKQTAVEKNAVCETKGKDRSKDISID